MLRRQVMDSKHRLCFSQRPLSSSSSSFFVFLLLLLFPHACIGARYRLFSEAAAAPVTDQQGSATTAAEAHEINSSSINPGQLRPAAHHRQTLSVDDHSSSSWYMTTLGVLPRGFPIPPSAPSKRHNSIDGDHMTAVGSQYWTASP